MNFIHQVEVVELKELLGEYRYAMLHAPDIAITARPGQFLHIRCSDSHDPLLRRPISIYKVSREKKTVGILYRVAGSGTARLERYSHLDVMGPLGNGFQMPSPELNIMVVAGGIGVAPLYFLLQEMSVAGQQAHVLLGASSVSHLLMVEEIKRLNHSIYLATDDGSAGYHGYVTDFCEDIIKRGIDEVFACGPRPMLAVLAGMLLKHNLPGQFSMEERMGCGIGACLACACKTRKDGSAGFDYSHICKDGPIFPADKVVWD